MPENVRGTSTSSGLDSMHTSTMTILLYKQCTMAISKYSRPSHLANYDGVVAFEPDLQRASFHGISDFLPHSTTIKLLPLYTHRKVLSEPQDLATKMGSHCQPCICCGAQVHAGSPCLSVLPTEAIANLG